jgi:hypothetical protein
VFTRVTKPYTRRAPVSGSSGMLIPLRLHGAA